MKKVVFYWPELNKLLITHSINDNALYSRIDAISHKLDPVKGKKEPRQLDSGVSITFESENFFKSKEAETFIVFSHDSLEQLYYVGVL